MENKLNLPAGEYTSPDGTCIVVAEDGTFTTKEAVTELTSMPKEEQMAIDTTEEDKKKEAEMSDLEVQDEVTEDLELAEVAPVDAPVQTEVLSYTKEEVDAKLDEIYKIIADLKAEDIASEEVDVPLEQTNLSVNERFAEFSRFITNSK